MKSPKCCNNPMRAFAVIKYINNEIYFQCTTCGNIKSIKEEI